MNKSKSEMTFNEYKKLTEQQYFGNDWGLFVVIDNKLDSKINHKRIKHVNDNSEINCDEFHYDSDYYYYDYDEMSNDIESNINIKNIKQKEIKYSCMSNCIKLSVMLVFSSILTYIIFYKF